MKPGVYFEHEGQRAYAPRATVRKWQRDLAQQRSKCLAKARAYAAQHEGIPVDHPLQVGIGCAFEAATDYGLCLRKIRAGVSLPELTEIHNRARDRLCHGAAIFEAVAQDLNEITRREHGDHSDD